ncbi:MAG: DegT/DnrJ/EryC1/StrS aminotransferase [Pseudoxanthomonas suwonensis]|nr:MAG: DegT/DnrJ/EryC1/StrS aminotransferase [Pseudoxanthomonas suwonensis]
MEKIPLLVPFMPTADQILPYLRQIDANRQYTNFGPLSRLLEQRLAETLSVGTENVTTVANCTAGLELILQARGLAPGTPVLLPALTFVATATAVSRVGMQPVIADVDSNSWSLTPEIARQAASIYRIGAVMPVATFGRAQDTAAWDAFERETGIPVIIDAAGAFGNQSAGSRADVVFSFHATKSFGAAEGGAVISPDPERIQWVRTLSNFGMDTRTSLLTSLGTNAKMSEYHCALGLASFDIWEKVKQHRRALHARYLDRLRAMPLGLEYQEKPADGIYTLMAVVLPEGKNATETGTQLARFGIETRRWYSPALHQQPALSACPIAGQLPVADLFSGRIIGLPFFPGITDPQIEHVCESLCIALDP